MMRLQIEKKTACRQWEREKDRYIHLDLLATSFLFHFLLYLIVSFLLTQNKQVPSSRFADSFHPIYILRLMKTSSVSMPERVGTRAIRKNPRKKERIQTVSISTSSPQKTRPSPRAKLIKSDPPSIIQKPLEPALKTFKPQTAPSLPIATPIKAVSPRSVAMQMDYQTIAKKPSFPSKATTMTEKLPQTTKTYPFKEKNKLPLPSRRLFRHQVANNPVPEKKKITVMAMEIQEKNIQKEKKLKEQTSSVSLVSKIQKSAIGNIAMTGKEALLKTMRDMESSHTLLDRKTMQPAKPIRSLKTSHTFPEKEIFEEQRKHAVTNRLLIPKPIKPSLYTDRREINSFPVIRGEKSKQHESTPATHMVKRKSEFTVSLSTDAPIHTLELEISVTPDQTTDRKIAKHIDRPTFNISPPTDARERQSISLKVFKGKEKLSIPTSNLSTGRHRLTDSLMPQREKAAIAQLTSYTADIPEVSSQPSGSASITRKKTMSHIAMTEDEVSLKTIPDIESSHTLLDGKTMQPAKPIRSLKTSNSLPEKEIFEEQIKHVPVTNRSILPKQTKPSLYSYRREIKSVPVIRGEESKQHESTPTTQTVKRKSEFTATLSTDAPIHTPKLEISVAPDQTAGLKIAMHIDRQASKKSISADAKEKQSISLKAYKGKEKLSIPTSSQSRITDSLMPKKEKTAIAQLTSDNAEIPDIPSQPSGPVSIARKKIMSHIATMDEEAYLKTTPDIESSHTISNRKSMQSTETIVSSKISNPRTEIVIERISSTRKETQNLGKQPQYYSTTRLSPNLPRITASFHQGQSKLFSTGISIIQGEKTQQHKSTPVTQTAKKIYHPASLTTKIQNRQIISLSAHNQSVLKITQDIRSPTPKPKVPLEEKKIDKQVHKDTRTNIALLTPGEPRKTDIYDIRSTSFKKKELDKKIYESFIVPQRRDKATLTSFLSNHFLNRNPVNKILVTSRGKLWAGIKGGILKYDGYKWDFLQSSGKLPGEVVSALAEAPDGSVWVGTENGLVRMDRSGNRILPSGKLSGEVFDIQIDGKGMVWAGTENGLFRYSENRWEKIDVPKEIAGYSVNTIIEDGKGKMWIGTEKGLSGFNGKKWTHFDTESGLINNVVNSLAVDTEGNIWCGTEEGVSRFNGKYWQSYTKDDGLADNTVYTVKTDSRGNVWFGTGAGVSKFNNYRFVNYDRSDGLLGLNVHSIAIAENGEYWFGSERGVSKMLEVN